MYKPKKTHKNKVTVPSKNKNINTKTLAPVQLNLDKFKSRRKPQIKKVVALNRLSKKVCRTPVPQQLQPVRPLTYGRVRALTTTPPSTWPVTFLVARTQAAAFPRRSRWLQYVAYLRLCHGRTSFVKSRRVQLRRLQPLSRYSRSFFARLVRHRLTTWNWRGRPVFKYHRFDGRKRRQLKRRDAILPRRVTKKFRILSRMRARIQQSVQPVVHRVLTAQTTPLREAPVMDRLGLLQHPLSKEDHFRLLRKIRAGAFRLHTRTRRFRRLLMRSKTIRSCNYALKHASSLAFRQIGLLSSSSNVLAARPITRKQRGYTVRSRLFGSARRTAITQQLLIGAAPLVGSITSTQDSTFLQAQVTRTQRSTPTQQTRSLPKKSTVYSIPATLRRATPSFTNYKRPVDYAWSSALALVPALGRTLQQGRYYEQLFYRSRQRLRLPKMTVTRRRRRKAGHGLFARHSLKQPATLRGKVSLLLPPSTVYSRLSVVKALGAQLTAHTLSTLAKRIDNHPRVWVRPPSRMNLKNIAPFILRRRRRAARRSRRRLHFYTKRVSQELRSKRRSVAFVNRPGAELSTALLVTSNNTPVTTKTVLLRRHNEAIEQTKRLGLWQVQSSHAIRTAERALSAWAPQLPVRWRRWSSPRAGGVPVARRWPSFKTLRDRHQINENLAFRNKPQKRYLDSAYSHLQFYRGSAATIGYERLRRVYRGGKSAFARWWRPVKYAVPFTHPYSRRGLACKKYCQRKFAAAGVSERFEPNASVVARLAAHGIVRRTKVQIIPWRNFSYRAPRFGGTPRTLQRWPLRSKRRKLGGMTGVRKTRLVLARSHREIRALEKTFFRKNVLAGHCWEGIDKSTATSAVSRQLLTLTKRLPSSAWGALQRKVGSPAKYATLQTTVFTNFRHWARENLQTSPISGAFTTEQETKAVYYLTKLVRELLSTSTEAELWAHLERTSYTVDSLVRGMFARKVTQKYTRFWNLRELPKLQTATSPSAEVTARGNSVMYKNWLQGASRFLRRSQAGYTPPAHTPYFNSAATNFGRRRLRFPASGRRKMSYDSLLHAFARRTGPAHVRRASRLKFKIATPRLTGDFREHLAASMLGGHLRRQRALAKTVTRAAYTSATWRELLTQQLTAKAVVQLSPHQQVKRRFATLPMNTVFTQARRHALSLMQVVPTLHALQSGMLRRALRKRRDERPFTDLRKSAQQRRLPKDQRPLPWKAKRAARRRSKAKFGPWNYRTLDNSPAAFSAWTLQRLAFTATQTDELTPVTTDNSISGETLTLRSTRIEREKRIRCGFAIVPKIRPKGLKRRKNRRRTKRFRGRARKLVTSALGDFRRYRHWSERRSQGSGTNYGTISRRLVISKRFSPVYKTLKRLSQRTTTLKRYCTALQDLRQQQSNKFILIRATRLATRLSATRLLNKKRPNRLKHHRASCNRLLVGPSRLASVDTDKQYVGKRLVKEVSLLSNISPLLFEKVTTRSIKTEAAKEKAIAANIASKETRYKFTAQYLESITAFIPALMNQILTKNILDKQITATYKAAQHLIRNIYWSLRVYLNVDPFDTRFTLRDSKPAARAALIEVLDKMAKSQTTEQPQRAALRYSFQSGRLHRAPSTWRFREDWLRVFFPSQHALFQESPEDYGLFLLSTKNIRRLRIGNKGIVSWRTARTTTSLETRSRQLLTLRTGKTPRFETALQHSRRTVLPESVPLATGAVLGRTNFFTRGFSTQARRTTLVVSRQLQQFRRFVPTESVELEGEQATLAIEKEKELPTATTFNIAVSRARIMPRIEARGRTNYAVEGRNVMAGGSLDLRFVRRKSPRSRQYLLRTPVQVATASKQKQVGALILSRQTCLLRQSSRPAVGWTRASRRSVSVSFIAPIHPEVTWLSPAVRRTLTALKWRTEFTVRRRAITQAATRRLKHISQRAHRAKSFEQSTPAQIAALRRTTLQANQDSTAGRAVLQSRTAGSRLVKVVPTASVTLRNAPIRQSWRFAKYLQARHQALVVNVKGPNQLKPKNKLHWEPAELGEYTPLTRREQNTRALTALALLQKNKKLLAATKQHYPRGRRRFRQRVSTATVSALQKSWLRGFRLPPQKPVQAGWKRRLRFSYQQVPNAVISMRERFINQSAHSAVDRAYLSRALPALTKARQETPFEAHRPKLWDGLSLRKMKRERIARRWLKETSRWLRDPWLAEIVSLRKRRGAYAAREQQIGEYVAEVDAEGRDVSEEHSPVREREALVKKGKNKPIKGRNLLHKLILKKPIPAMWLAQHEYKDVLREYAENKKKSWKELVAEKEAEIKEWNLREKSGVAHEKPRRAPLKHPADNWLPHGIWKEIQRRLRKFEWRESDEVFFRKGFQNAFRFFPQEYSRAPWLEALMYTRATYSTRLREFRRRQFPREQKKYKWLQRVRKSLAPTKAARYLKGRRWPQLRTYNQKLHYSLFNLPDRRAASRHFQKLARRSRPTISSFVASQQGLGDRLDVTLLHLNVVPSIFWARVVAPFGLLRVNGKILYNCASRISPGDLIQPEWDRISRFQHFFKSALKQRDTLQEKPQVLTSAYPKNFEFHRGVRAMFYRHAPEETDIRQSNRLQPHLFRWFRLDSV